MLPKTRWDREELPVTEVDLPPSAPRLVSAEPNNRPTVVRRPSTAWISDSHSQLGEEEFRARYRVRGQIGQGGMGEVCLTRDVRIGRDVAAKFLHDSHAARPDLRARFIREACLQGQLEHPSIVPVHDLGVAPDGRLFFTMKRI